MEWERVNPDKNFCMRFENGVSSTRRDHHGDKLTVEALKYVKKDMAENPDKRLMYYKHQDDELR